MTVWNLGSINIDYFYEVPHLPGPGETISATAHRVGLGGKGANQSVAAARAGAVTRHIGMIGADGGWTVERLQGFGVDTTHVGVAEAATAHAIIMVDAGGENAIVIHPGANAAQSGERIAAALEGAAPGDTLLLQNETSHQAQAARIAREKGLRVVYSAAPFNVDAVRAVLPYVTVLVLNEVEEVQLAESLGTPDVAEVIVTQGAKGARWAVLGDAKVSLPAFAVTPVDTTGAGDCFIGSLVAASDLGMTREEALRFASAAAALQVTRPGTADAMPDRAEVEAFLRSRS